MVDASESAEALSVAREAARDAAEILLASWAAIGRGVPVGKNASNSASANDASSTGSSDARIS